MPATAIDHVYTYPFASSVRPGQGGVRLVVATSGGDAVRYPHFYSGGLLAPARAAQLLLAVSGVAATRFYVPPAMLNRILQAADPIVLSDGERLRFEALSACCGVYARADLLPNALAVTPVGRGTTNVDFNPPMRAALAGLRDELPVSLSVGDDGLRLEHRDAVVEERRVRLPRRWVRSLGEVQALQAAMSPAIRVGGAEAFRFLRALPRAGSGRAACFVVPSGTGLRLAHAPTPGGVRLVGTERLRALEAPARAATELRIFAHPSGASAWCLEFTDARLVLIVSPEPSRGLSGEGGLLEDSVATPVTGEARLLAALRWGATPTAADLAVLLGVDPSVIRGRLAGLAAGGLVGYDLAESTYFYRAMPIAVTDADASQPRLARAREMVDAGHVAFHSAADHSRAVVKGRDGEYVVSMQGDQPTCTCTWFARHGRERGPCSHVLATQMSPTV